MATAAMRKAFQQARTEFKELSIGELKEYEALFIKYDTGKVRRAFFAVCSAVWLTVALKDGFLDLMELKYMMEKLGFPQTHLGLKAMIKEVGKPLSFLSRWTDSSSTR
jgi:hypothetical protein